jgi:hypothetical protein
VAGSPGYRNGSFAEISIAENTEWSPAKIVQRSVELMEFFEKRWRLTTRTKSERIKLLGLESLNNKIKAASRSRPKADSD